MQNKLQYTEKATLWIFCVVWMFQCFMIFESIDIVSSDLQKKEEFCDVTRVGFKPTSLRIIASIDFIFKIVIMLTNSAMV